MMRSESRSVVLAVAALAAASCGVDPGAQTATARQAVTVASVRFAELHYDNTGTDVGEAIEVSGPAGMDVTGWQVVLYNGNGGASYSTQTLSGVFPATCGGRGVFVLTYATNGVQNGGSGTATDSPDGMALVDAGGAVVEFLSYEGVFAATNGPALGMTSTDIGVRELGNEPVGKSLQRSGDGTWSGPIDATFTACNDNGDTPPPEVVSVSVAPASATVAVDATQAFTATGLDAANQPISGVTFTWTTSDAAVATVNASGVATGVAAGDATITATAPSGIAGSASLHVNAPQTGMPDTRFSEIHYDNVGVDVNEALEIEGPAGTDLTGWTIALYDGSAGGTLYSTTPLTGTIPATCDARGVIVVNYPLNGIQNGSPDGFALVDASGAVVEFLSYEGTLTAADGPAAGMLSTDIVAQEPSSAPVGQSLQRDGSNRWQQATHTFGACNPPGGGIPGNTINFTGRAASDPALPVGFQAQVFAQVRDPNNQIVTTTITWTSEAPAIATIDQNGVFTGLAAGTAILRATAADGVTTAITALPVQVATASTTASYAGNTEFGDPTDADPSDDFIVRHAQYTASYNPNRNTPNWVSHNLDASAFGSQDRCNCFTFDPQLPASFLHYTTADYTGSGAIAGFGIDRGHLVRSFDRTSGSLDNAFTFYFTNIVPQTADLNQGPWSDLEIVLGDLARFQNKEVYIVTGVAGNRGTLKNEGKIVIPASTWKVAVIMPRDHGLANIRDYRDLEVIAVDMPNEPGVRNVPWQTYLTTVDAIEASTGYDLLALLSDKVESTLEAGIKPPLAFVDGPYATSEGGAITASAAASLDPNGTVVSYLWSFGDGATSTDPVATHTYAQDGVYTVSLTVTDNDGLTDTSFTTTSVVNIAPTVGAFAGAALLPGELYTASGSFTDPGADLWTATADYGDGSAATLALSDKTFALSHTYTKIGAFTVTVRVSDDDAVSSATQAVTVISQAQAARNAIVLVDQLAAAGKITQNVGNVLRFGLQLAATALDARLPVLAALTLQVVVVEIDLLIQLRRLSAADAVPLRSLVVRTLRSTNLLLSGKL